MIKPFKNCSTDNITQYYTDTHKAIDWLPFRKAGLGAYGTPLVAPENCTVLRQYTINTPRDDDDNQLLKSGFGVILLGVSGYQWTYWHTQPIFPVSIGDTVNAGQIVAYCGNSGNVSVGGTYVPLEERDVPNFAGTHLHEQISDQRLDSPQRGYPVNPLTLIDFSIEPSYTILDELKAISITLLKISNILKK